MVRTMLDVVEEEANRVVEDSQGLGHDDFIEVILPISIGANDNVAIVDIETTGLSPTSSEIITLGMIYSHYIHIIQRMNMENGAFKKLVMEKMEELDGRGFSFFAFNCGFEDRFLDNVYEWNEIQPYRIAKDKCIVFDHFHFGTGRDALSWWKKWKSEQDIDMIINIEQMKKESIWIRSKYY